MCDILGFLVLIIEGRYEKIVRQAKEYIAAGDIFQVVLARRWTVDDAPPPPEPGSDALAEEASIQGAADLRARPGEIGPAQVNPDHERGDQTARAVQR